MFTQQLLPSEVAETADHCPACLKTQPALPTSSRNVGKKLGFRGLQMDFKQIY